MHDAYLEAQGRVGDDLCSALYHNDCEIQGADIARIELEQTGANDGPSWHWIVCLNDGRFAYVEGGCDATGWDCQSHCYICFASSIEQALLTVSEAPRAIFEAMLASGEKRREIKSYW